MNRRHLLIAQRRNHLMRRLSGHIKPIGHSFDPQTDTGGVRAFVKSVRQEVGENYSPMLLKEQLLHLTDSKASHLFFVLRSHKRSKSSFEDNNVYGNSFNIKYPLMHALWGADKFPEHYR